MIEVRLSKLPPSVNSMYVNVPRIGRVKSKRYKQWVDLMSWQMVGIKRCNTEKYGLVIFINPRSNGDITNYIKPIEDLLVHHKITADDRHNVYTSVIRRKGNPVIWVLNEVECNVRIKIDENL